METNEPDISHLIKAARSDDDFRRTLLNILRAPADKREHLLLRLSARCGATEALRRFQPAVESLKTESTRLDAIRKLEGTDNRSSPPASCGPGNAKVQAESGGQNVAQAEFATPKSERTLEQQTAEDRQAVAASFGYGLGRGLRIGLPVLLSAVLGWIVGYFFRGSLPASNQGEQRIVLYILYAVPAALLLPMTKSGVGKALAIVAYVVALLLSLGQAQLSQ